MSKTYPMSPRTRSTLESLAMQVADSIGGAEREQAYTLLQDECASFDASRDNGCDGPRMTYGLCPDATAAPLRRAADGWVQRAHSVRSGRLTA